MDDPGERDPGQGRRRRRGRRRGRSGRGRGKARGTDRPPRGDDALSRAAWKYFGIRSLKWEQRVAMEALLRGRDAMAVLPTGFGKSLIYQVPAMLAGRPTVVISPLIALMADQHDALRRRRLPVVRLDSTLRVGERRDALARIEAGGSLVILTTPETLQSDDVAPVIAQSEPWLLCIDEAHCISEWGHDFRPAYLRLGSAREDLGEPVALALTATATPHVRDDIAARLQLHEPVRVHAPPYRDNLRFSVQQVPGGLKAPAAAKRIRRLPRPGVVYCSTTAAVDGIANALVRARIGAERYHGKLRKAEREHAQARFLGTNKRLVMVATSAFGMGIDKPDIRYVLHYQAPGSLEQYVQEAGRAGRDGKPATCELLWDPADLDIQRALLEKSRARPGQLRRVANALAAWEGEGREVDVPGLALSAGVPQTVARATAAELEALGVVRFSAAKKLRVTATPAALHATIDDLVARLETQRREDERRLRAVAEYATAKTCRSAILRRWFGEDDPPDCGHCDQCRAAKRFDDATAALRDARREAGGEERPSRRRRRRRRRKGRRPPQGS